MGLLTFITQACDQLSATTAPSVDALGVHMIIALATIMLVWFGAQEALASAHGGAGFSMAKFLNLFMLLTFAYVLVAFYDSAIPQVGYSLKGFINGGAQYLVAIIGNDSVTTMQNALAQAQSTVGPGIIKTIADPYYALVFFFIQVMLAFFAATLSLIVGYGAIASTVVGMFGPIMIPFLAFDKLAFSLLGLAPRIHRILLLQGCSRRRTERSGEFAFALLHDHAQLRRSGNDGEAVATSHPADLDQYLRAIPGAAPHDEHFLGLYRRQWQRADDNRSPSLKGLISEARMMNSEAMTSPEITRAAERYLEQYGDPLVMNTYLKVAVLALSAVAVALTGVVFKSHQALASAKPLIIRIDNVGRAEAIDYRDFQYRPQEAENKYYLGRWAELYFSRNRFTLVRDQTASLYFMNSDVQRDVIEQERKAQTIPNYLKDSGLPYVTIVVKNVILDDLKMSPYSARIEFERIYTNVQDMHELKREELTASVTYVFRDSVHNQQLAVNPLGLTIIRFRVDQAFN